MKQFLAVLLAAIIALSMTLDAGAVSSAPAVTAEPSAQAPTLDEDELPPDILEDPSQPQEKKPALLDTPILRSVTASVNGVVFCWNKVEGAIRYRAFRKEGSSGWKIVGDTARLSITDKKAVSGHTYTYTVRCITASGENASDYQKSGLRIRFVAAPVIQSVKNVYGGVTVKWKKSAGAVRYQLLKKTNNGGWKKVANTYNVSYTDKAVRSGYRYTYTVRCITANAKSYTSGYLAKGRTIQYIAAPVISSVRNSGLRLTIRWNKSAGAAYYRVLYKVPGGKWKKLGDTASASLSYTHPARTSTEVYTVRCMNKAKTAYTSGYDPKGYTFTLTVAAQSAASSTVPSYGSSSSGSSSVRSTSSHSYVGNRSSKVFHYSTCSSAKRMSSSNRITFSSAEAAKSAGYRACKNCRPR